MMATYHVTSISYLVYGHAQFNFLQIQARLQAQQVRCVVRFVQLPVQFIISFIKPALKNKKAKSSSSFTLRQLEPAANTWKKIIQSLRFKKTEDSEFFCQWTKSIHKFEGFFLRGQVCSNDFKGFTVA